MTYSMHRVHGAAVAGWWTLLWAVLLLSFSWLLFLGLMNAQPSWVSSLWGPGVSWDFIQVVGIWAIAIFKVCLWLLAVVALWLTLWARQLRKSAT